MTTRSRFRGGGICLCLTGLFLGLVPLRPAGAEPRINEFLAANARGLDDEDRQESDWIEILNPDAEPVDLEGWFLTDDPGKPTLWRFPAVTLGPGDYLVVFASGKDRRRPGRELHTNFKLRSAGEYLALVRPDGLTPVTAFAPKFPPQIPDMAYGASGGRPVYRYLPIPTPGSVNGPGIDHPGPRIREVAFAPQVAVAGQDLWVRAEVTPIADPVSRVSLYYRVMFGPETRTPMRDDGQSGDGQSGDGVYGGRIPAAVVRNGQMIRWTVRAWDSAGRSSRHPAAADPANSPLYDGTVVVNPGLNSALPILYRFAENPSGANSSTGTRVSLFFEGVFYDNLRAYLHGQSSRGFPKKSYNVDLHPGYNFRWAPGEPRADDINLMTTYPDKAQMRNILAYLTYREAGCAYHWVIPVRVQENGGFWGTAHLMENGDEDWLIRMGLNADGALYKMYNRFTQASHVTSGAEKKTRKSEANDDLRDLFNGLQQSAESRRRFLYDQVDVASVVNFLAARMLTGDTDCCHKNYYLYRDTGRSDEWQMWPWDVDLSFGRRWISSKTYWDEVLHPETPVFIGSNQGLVQAIYGTGEMRQMFLRRARTLMDSLLKPPGTPPEDLFYEPLIDSLAAQLAPDAALDAAKWGSDAWGRGSTAPCCPQSLLEAADELKYVYLPERRRQLYEGLAPGADELPAAQPADVWVAVGFVDLVTADPNGGYVQLVNTNTEAVDLSGWSLSGAVSFTFRGGTVIPAGGVLYVAALRSGFRARTQDPTGGQGHFVVGDYGAPRPGERRLSLRRADGSSVLRITDVGDHAPAPASR